MPVVSSRIPVGFVGWPSRVECFPRALLRPSNRGGCRSRSSWTSTVAWPAFEPFAVVALDPLGEVESVLGCRAHLRIIIIELGGTLRMYPHQSTKTCKEGKDMLNKNEKVVRPSGLVMTDGTPLIHP